ncbi:reprolysin-like metallopeptidase [Chromobacterium violaceum]|nr:hypothetical protein [Chromobacterium violaceum]
MSFRSLFHPAFFQAPASLEQQKQGRIFTFDAQALLQAVEQALAGGEPGGMNLTPFPGVGGDCLTHKVESPRQGLYLWRGIGCGGQDISASLAFSARRDGDALAVLLAGNMAVGNRHYLIHPDGENQARVALWVPAVVARCGAAAHSPAPARASYAPDAPGLDRDRASEDEAAQSSEQAPAVISVCAFYPPAEAREHLRLGEAEMELLMLLVQEDTNIIFANSQIPARVHIEARALDTPPQHIDSLGLFGEAVGGLQSPDGKPIPGNDRLHAELASHLAEGKTDIIALLAVHGTQTPGERGVLVGKAGDIPAPPNAATAAFRQRVLVVPLQVTRPSGKPWDLLSPDHAFAHELGHLLGARHSSHEDMESEDVSDRLYGYVRGYIPRDKSFFTVMAYSMDANEGARALPMYSDHEQTYNGQPVGVAPGLPNAASAAPFLRWSAREVSRYKTGGLKPETDGVVSLKVAVWGIVDQQGAVVELKGADEAEAAIVIPRGQIHLPQHSAVTVIVAPREGVRLDHWKIDGASFVGMQRHTAEWPVQLLMDKSHAVDIYLDIQACVVPAPRCQPAAAINLFPRPGASLQGAYLVPAGRTKTLEAFFAQQVAAAQVVEWREDGVAKAWGHAIHRVELSSTGPRELEAMVKPRDCGLVIERIPMDEKSLSYFDDEPRNELRYGAAKGQKISLEYPNFYQLFDHWELNGQRLVGRQGERNVFCYLDFVIERDSVVRLCLHGWQDAVAVTFEFVPPVPGRAVLRFRSERNADFHIDLHDSRRAYHFSKRAQIHLHEDTAKIYGVTHWASADDVRRGIDQAIVASDKLHVRFFRQA